MDFLTTIIILFTYRNNPLYKSGIKEYLRSPRLLSLISQLTEIFILLNQVVNILAAYVLYLGYRARTPTFPILLNNPLSFFSFNLLMVNHHEQAITHPIIRKCKQIMELNIIILT